MAVTDGTVLPFREEDSGEILALAGSISGRDRYDRLLLRRKLGP